MRGLRFYALVFAAISMLGFAGGAFWIGVFVGPEQSSARLDRLFDMCIMLTGAGFFGILSLLSGSSGSPPKDGDDGPKALDSKATP